MISENTKYLKKMEEARSLLSSKAIGQAEAAFEAATRYTDAPFDALFNAGLAAFQIGASGRALERFDACVKLRPHHTSALNNRGTCLQICGRDLEAIADFDAALAKSPGYADCWYNRGISLFNLEAYEEAAESYDQALRHGAAAAKIFNNKGRALHALGRIDEAIGCYRHALELDSGYPRAHLNLAVSQLTKGNFRDGFLEFEWRKVQPEMAAGARTYPAPLWTGKEDLSGKSVLVHWEQGFGDTIQFCRYLGLLENRGAKVEFAPQKPLRDLLSSLKVKASMDALDGGNVSIHYHIPLLSLPLAFGTSLDTIPANTPYLAAEPQRVENWRKKLGDRGFKIGICWQGNKAGDVDRGRSFPLKQFEPLSKIPGVRLISLQKGDGEEQLRDLPDGMEVESLGPDFDTDGAFLDTAAVMECVDLVITSDTAIAHLAGALARPVWIALKSVPDWRWMLERNDSPWYPTARLFRQKTRGDWDGVFQDIKFALQKKLAQEN